MGINREGKVFLCMCGIVCVGGSWIDLAFKTKRLNPIEQLKTFNHYNSSYKKVLGEKGLADVNQDGKIDGFEAADAFKRMGIDLKFGYEQNGLNNQAPYVNIPNPTQEQLDKAIESYKKKE